MRKENNIKVLLSLLQPGDRVLIEYNPLARIENLVWRKVIPELISDGPLMVVDMYGIGGVLFRNYLRNASPSEYRPLIKAKGKIYVFKLGPGNPGYGNVVGEDKIPENSDEFLKVQYWAIRKALNFPEKPRFMVTFGLSEFLLFRGKEGAKDFLHATVAIPVEDWAIITFLNISSVEREVVAVLEELSTHVLLLDGETLKVLKGGRGSEGRRKGSSRRSEGEEVPGHGIKQGISH
ncbi:hypothetical protein [Thermococcus waiotapuensis]|uniref:Uncharacterized protein n=1 Tax=Thermococcus waiotapuensis TaxID=90909 RepID=A0AAE4NUR9_9EURY|nr:hypothetical protein [Thermococcus waiotapuensis]MDV3104743.1 hypothetical protein [Thermococcus waiotapuensis]